MSLATRPEACLNDATSEAYLAPWHFLYSIDSTPDTHRPLFIANSVVDDYSENRVDTLHTKNLLHLGEDRYLTTLVLKHFGNYKTIFVRDAKAKTAAPEDWGVLLSQRRRWINSTVHNLFELIFTPGLCGFCLVSDAGNGG